MKNTAPMKSPPIKKLQDYDDPVQFCFYMLGYVEGVRSEPTIEPEEENRQAYEEGVRDGEHFTRWLLLAAINNKN